MRIEDNMGQGGMPDINLSKRKIARGPGLLSPKLERPTDQLLELQVSDPMKPMASPLLGGSEVQSKFLSNAYFK